MAIKELLVDVGVPVAAAMISGLTVWFVTPDWETSARTKGWVSSAEWQAGARRADWIPKGECPAYPVTVKIVSPGEGASLRVKEDTIYSRFVIETSRPIADADAIYLIVQRLGDPNIYILKRIYGNSSGLVKLPFKIAQPGKVSFWAIVVPRSPGAATDEREGEIYTDVAQIRALKDLLCISDPVQISLFPSE
jgi:hypothetical protein